MDIHDEAIRLFGEGHQIDRTVEELNELSVDLMKSKRRDGGIPPFIKLKLTEEIADVLETLAYPCKIYGITKKEITEARSRKRKKLIKYIEEAEKASNKEQ